MCSKPKAPKSQPLPPARQLARQPTTILGASGMGDSSNGLQAPRTTVAQNEAGQRIIGRSRTAGLGASGVGAGALPEMITQAANRQAMRKPAAQSGAIINSPTVIGNAQQFRDPNPANLAQPAPQTPSTTSATATPATNTGNPAAPTGKKRTRAVWDSAGGGMWFVPQTKGAQYIDSYGQNR